MSTIVPYHVQGRGDNPTPHAVAAALSVSKTPLYHQASSGHRAIATVPITLSVMDHHAPPSTTQVTPQSSTATAFGISGGLPRRRVSSSPSIDQGTESFALGLRCFPAPNPKPSLLPTMDNRDSDTHLVAHETDLHPLAVCVFPRVLSDALHPVPDVVESIGVRHVVHQHNTVRPSVVGLCDLVKPLLSTTTAHRRRTRTRTRARARGTT